MFVNKKNKKIEMESFFCLAWEKKKLFGSQQCNKYKMGEIHSSGLADHAHPVGTKTWSSGQAIKDLIYDVVRLL